MSRADADTVFLTPGYTSSGSKRVYHTREDCPWAKRANSLREVTRDFLWDDTDECSYCQKATNGRRSE